MQKIIVLLNCLTIRDAGLPRISGAQLYKEAGGFVLE